MPPLESPPCAGFINVGNIKEHAKSIPPITIANLKDLDRILDNITYEKYKKMKKNSEEIGNSVRQGKFTKTAVEEIIRKVDNLGDITK